MTTLTVADFADTGQWRLTVNIFPTGIEALLENTLHTDIEPQSLFRREWDANPETLLQNIENAIYDNPRVLDDFSARIVLYDRRMLFVPTEIAEECEGMEEKLYTDIYPSEPGDVIIETEGGLTAVSSFAPGLKGFLNRTFPGARISTNLMTLACRCMKAGGGKRLHVEQREREADFILTDSGRLVSASTHTVRGEDELLYHSLNILGAYGLRPEDVELPGPVKERLK